MADKKRTRKSDAPNDPATVEEMSAFAWGGSDLNTAIALLAERGDASDGDIRVEPGSELHGDAIASPMFAELVRQFHREGGLESPGRAGRPASPEQGIPDALVMFGLRLFCAATCGKEQRGVRALARRAEIEPGSDAESLLKVIEFFATETCSEGHDDPGVSDYRDVISIRRPLAAELLNKCRKDPSLVALLPLILEAGAMRL